VNEQLIEFRQGWQAKMTDELRRNKAPKELLLLVRTMSQAAYQFLRDCNTLLVTAGIEKDGLSLHAHAAIRPGTSSAKLFKQFKPSALEEIGTLPASQYTFDVASGDFTKLFEPLAAKLGDLAGPVVPFPAKMREKDRPRALLSARPARESQDALSVLLCSDPKAVAERTLRSLSTVKPDGVNGLKAAPTIKKDAGTHRGIKFHHVKLVYNFALWTKVDKRVAEAMRLHLGGEGEEYWFGASDKAFFELRAPTWKAATAQLDAYLDGKETLGSLMGFKEARKRLAAKASFLFIEETDRWTQVTLDGYAKEEKVKLKPLVRLEPQKREFLAWSMTVDEGGISVDAWGPIQYFRRYMEVVMAGPQK
jgi:hypothetical protein